MRQARSHLHAVDVNFGVVHLLQAGSDGGSQAASVLQLVFVHPLVALDEGQEGLGRDEHVAAVPLKILLTALAHAAVHVAHQRDQVLLHLQQWQSQRKSAYKVAVKWSCCKHLACTRSFRTKEVDWRMQLASRCCPLTICAHVRCMLAGGSIAKLLHTDTGSSETTQTPCLTQEVCQHPHIAAMLLHP